MMYIIRTVLYAVVYCLVTIPGGFETLYAKHVCRPIFLLFRIVQRFYFKRFIFTGVALLQEIGIVYAKIWLSSRIYEWLAYGIRQTDRCIHIVRSPRKWENQKCPFTCESITMRRNRLMTLAYFAWREKVVKQWLYKMCKLLFKYFCRW